jgi:type I restriction enzyme, S subunit
MTSKKGSRKDAKTQSKPEQPIKKKSKSLGVSASLRQTEKEEGKPTLVPKLRFPEFRDAEGWRKMPLSEAAQINPPQTGFPESFIYINLESVNAGELKAKTRISRDGAPSRAQCRLEFGDVIYQVVRPYQRNNLLCEFDDSDDYVASTGYAQVRAKGSNRFLYQSIHTDAFVSTVMAKSTGSNYPAINSTDLAEIKLPLPPTLAEQHKIADCLSSMDEVIAGQARKVNALKTHKKGLMQQLFPSPEAVGS